MTSKEALSALQALSDEKIFAHDIKRGADKNQFGVKLGDIRTVANRIKSDHALALELWKMKNVDARLLALLIIKPKSLTTTELDEMLRSINYVQVAEWFNSYILKDHPQREEMREAWMDSDNVWTARAGWSLMAGKVARDAEGVDLKQLLNRIHKEMPTAPEEVQWTMNTTLAQIGIHFPEHRKRALEIGEELGIYRNYPVSKGCTSPFAPIWIWEMVKRRNERV